MVKCTSADLLASQGRNILDVAARLLREIGWGRTLQRRYDLTWRMSYRDWRALGALPSDFLQAVDYHGSKLFGITVRWNADEEQDLELVIRPVHR